MQLGFKVARTQSNSGWRLNNDKRKIGATVFSFSVNWALGSDLGYTWVLIWAKNGWLCDRLMRLGLMSAIIQGLVLVLVGDLLKYNTIQLSSLIKNKTRLIEDLVLHSQLCGVAQYAGVHLVAGGDVVVGVAVGTPDLVVVVLVRALVGGALPRADEALYSDHCLYQEGTRGEEKEKKTLRRRRRSHLDSK